MSFEYLDFQSLSSTLRRLHWLLYSETSLRMALMSSIWLSDISLSTSLFLMYCDDSPRLCLVVELIAFVCLKVRGVALEPIRLYSSNVIAPWRLTPAAEYRPVEFEGEFRRVLVNFGANFCDSNFLLISNEALELWFSRSYLTLTISFYRSSTIFSFS